MEEGWGGDFSMSNEVFRRQNIVLGKESTDAVRGSAVFIIGVDSMTYQIAKCLVQMGVSRLHFQDSNAWDPYKHSGSLFHATPAESSMNVEVAAAAARGLERLAEGTGCLLSSDGADITSHPQDFSCVDDFDVVICNSTMLQIQCDLNEYCRERGVKFVMAVALGVFGWMFVDQGGQFTSTAGEKTVRIRSINKDEGIVETVEPHAFGVGDSIRFKDLMGADVLNKVTQTVLYVLDDHTFQIESIAFLSEYRDGGSVTRLKIQNHHSHLSLAESLESPRIQKSEQYSKEWTLFLGMMSFDAFVNRHHYVPSPYHHENAQEIAKLARRYAKLYKLKLDPEGQKRDSASQGVDFDDALLRLMSYNAQGLMVPFSQFLGGICAQEVIKVLTMKDTSDSQWIFHHMSPLLPSLQHPKGMTLSDHFPDHTFQDGLRICLGHDTCLRMKEASVLIVGCGGVGCEIAASLAIMGVGMEGNGRLHVVDGGVVEPGSLSGQMLYTIEDLGLKKARVAARSLKEIRPECRVEYTALPFSPSNLSTFTDRFLSQFDVVFTCVDNPRGRHYVVRRCVLCDIPVIQAVPNMTEGSVHFVEKGDSDPPPCEKEETIPWVNVKYFPTKGLHLVTWAQRQFTKLFSIYPVRCNKIHKNHEEYMDDLYNGKDSIDVTAALRSIVRTMDFQAKTIDGCIAFARIKFDQYFNFNPHCLLGALPAHQQVKVRGRKRPFWEAPLHMPTPIEFDPTNHHHAQFIVSATNLWAQCCGVVEVLHPDDIVARAAQMELPRRWSDGNRIKSTDPRNTSTDRPVKKFNKSEVKELVESILARKFINRNFAYKRLHPLPMRRMTDSDPLNQFIISAANIRASVYGMPSMGSDEIARIMWGIIPSVSSISTALGGLACVEFIKKVQRLVIPTSRWSTPDPAEVGMGGGWENCQEEADHVRQESIDLSTPASDNPNMPPLSPTEGEMTHQRGKMSISSSVELHPPHLTRLSRSSSVSLSKGEIKFIAGSTDSVEVTKPINAVHLFKAVKFVSSPAQTNYEFSPFDKWEFRAKAYYTWKHFEEHFVENYGLRLHTVSLAPNGKELYNMNTTAFMLMEPMNYELDFQEWPPKTEYIDLDVTLWSDHLSEVQPAPVVRYFKPRKVDNCDWGAVRSKIARAERSIKNISMPNLENRRAFESDLTR